MNYSDTLDWLFSKLPMYQRQGRIAFKKDLTNSLALSNHLDNPEKKFKSIHVAGTNGNGSCSHILASILRETGYKVGLYTSPHLKDFRERIRVNGKCITKNGVINFVKRNHNFLEKQGLSFFEMTVGMAFEYFAKQNVDIAIIEVGLGGRLDSTNIILPELAIITNIGFDHTQFLGDTLAEIAFEKAGIIKENIPTIIGETTVVSKQVFEKIALEKDSKLVFAKNFNTEIFPSDLKGSYQKHNIQTVLASIHLLKENGYDIATEHIKNGLLSVVKNTGIEGRWQVIGYEPKIICDTAHNKEGLQYTLQQLKQENYQQLHIVLGVVNDKSLDGILSLFPKEAIYYFCKARIPRALGATILQKEAKKFNLTGNEYQSVKDALKKS